LAEIVFVGGGTLGSSIAWHLAGDANVDGSITVIERDPTYMRASSVLSASSIRQQLSTPLNIHLSRYGIGFLRQAKEVPDVDLGLREPGYCSWRGGRVRRCCGQATRSRGGGLRGRLLDPAGLAGRFPTISGQAWRSRRMARQAKAGSMGQP